MKSVLKKLICLTILSGAAACVDESEPGQKDIGSVTLSVSQPGSGLDIEIESAVHLIEFHRCDGSCNELMINGLPYFEPIGDDSYLEVPWETGVGTELLEGPEWRGPAAIRGHVSYGEMPPGAGYATDAAPLEEGVRYAVIATLIGPCDDNAEQCFHQDAVGGAFFTFEEGLSMSFDLVETPYE
jgi:hypothetical protein